MPAISAEKERAPTCNANAADFRKSVKVPFVFPPFALTRRARAKGNGRYPNLYPWLEGSVVEKAERFLEKERKRKNTRSGRKWPQEMEWEGDGEKIAAGVLEKKGGGKEAPFSEKRKGRFHKLFGSVGQMSWK